MKTFIEQLVNIKTKLKEIKYAQTQTNDNYNILAKKMKNLEYQMSDLQKKNNIWPHIHPSRTEQSKFSNPLTDHPVSRNLPAPRHPGGPKKNLQNC